MSELHVVLGAGQVGAKVAEALVSRGHRVRIVRRSAGASPVAGAELVRADLADTAAAVALGRGAVAVYQCTNPAYHRWPQELMPNTEGALAVAREAGRLVVLDNVYALGKVEVRRATSPHAPVSKKGELRAKMADRLLDAHARGEARVAIARAADFVGPGVELALFGERFWSRALTGRAVELFGDPSLPHAYTYAPDVARALVALGSTDAGLGAIHVVPTCAARGTDAWVEAFARALGRPITSSRVPRWVLSAMGLFVPEVAEMGEMLYQWEAPFLLDHGDFPARFGVAPTPFEAQVQATVRWAEQRFAPRAAA
jgi:nucleoside-diphosphate-sugar epimerase